MQRDLRRYQVSNGITDKLINLFRSDDEEPLIKEDIPLEQSLLDEWKSTDYIKTHPGMDRNTRYDYNFSPESYKDLGEWTGIDLDRVMMNLAPVTMKRTSTGEVAKQELHRRFKRIQRDIASYVPSRDREGYTKEHWKKIEDILYGKYESYGDFKKGLYEIQAMDEER